MKPMKLIRAAAGPGNRGEAGSPGLGTRKYPHLHGGLLRHNALDNVS